MTTFLDVLAHTLLWIALIAVAFRVVSLVHPHPFPTWLTPLLEVSPRRRDDAIERTRFAPGMRVLEVGPGHGYLTAPALERIGPEGRLVCLDVQPAMLRKLRATLGVQTPALVCASGSSLPFRAGSFDLVFLSSVLGEIPDKAGALDEYRRVLRPHGVLAVTESMPDPDFVRTPVLRRLAERAGFEARERVGHPLRYTYRFTRS